MKLSKYFTLHEAIESHTAKAHKIDNNPSNKIVSNLIYACEKVDPVRKKWDSGVRISSGYRSPELNRKLGGVSTSHHCLGHALDLVPVNGKVYEWGCLLYKELETWDQLIFEGDEDITKCRWIHLSFYNSFRKQVMQYPVWRVDEETGKKEKTYVHVDPSKLI